MHLDSNDHDELRRTISNELTCAATSFGDALSLGSLSHADNSWCLRMQQSCEEAARAYIRERTLSDDLDDGTDWAQGLSDVELFQKWQGAEGMRKRAMEMLVLAKMRKSEGDAGDVNDMLE